MITEESVQDVVRRIVERVQPEKVIAFGSWVEGRAGKDSDLDLLVILPIRGEESRFRKSGEVRNAARNSPFPMDIIVRSPEDIDRRLSVGDYFIHGILKHGRVLYPSSF